MARRFDDRRGFERYQTVTPHVARACLAARTHLNSADAGKAVGMTREALALAVRRAEAVLDVRLFGRTKNVVKWALLPGNVRAWAKIERIAAEAQDRYALRA